MEARPQSNEQQPEEIGSFLAGLNTFINEHHPKKSRMIQAIVNGTASQAALRKFAKEFYAYSVASLKPFAALVANSPDETSLRLMLQNFAGEAGLLDTPPHPVMFRDFLRATGVSDDEIDSHVPLPTTLGAMFALDHFLRGPFDEAVAGFGFAIEGPAADWGKLIYDGLKANYGFDDTAMRFWKAHMEEDDEGMGLEEQHGENARRLMQRYASSHEQQVRIKKAFVYSALVFENFWAGMDRFLDE